MTRVVVVSLTLLLIACVAPQKKRRKVRRKKAPEPRQTTKKKEIPTIAMVGDPEKRGRRPRRRSKKPANANYDRAHELEYKLRNAKKEALRKKAEEERLEREAEEEEARLEEEERQRRREARQERLAALRKRMKKGRKPRRGSFHSSHIPGLGKPRIVIDNQTAEVLKLSMSGPGTANYRLPARKKTSIRVRAGRYQFDASIGERGRGLTTNGFKTFKQDHAYTWTFQIVQRKGGW